MEENQLIFGRRVYIVFIFWDSIELHADLSFLRAQTKQSCADQSRPELRSAYPLSGSPIV